MRHQVAQVIKKESYKQYEMFLHFLQTLGINKTELLSECVIYFIEDKNKEELKKFIDHIKVNRAGNAHLEMIATFKKLEDMA